MFIYNQLLVYQIPFLILNIFLDISKPHESTAHVFQTDVAFLNHYFAIFVETGEAKQDCCIVVSKYMYP